MRILSLYLIVGVFLGCNLNLYSQIEESEKALNDLNNFKDNFYNGSYNLRYAKVVEELAMNSDELHEMCHNIAIEDIKLQFNNVFSGNADELDNDQREIYDIVYNANYEHFGKDKETFYSIELSNNSSVLKVNHFNADNKLMYSVEDDYKNDFLKKEMYIGGVVNSFRNEPDKKISYSKMDGLNNYYPDVIYFCKFLNYMNIDSSITDFTKMQDGMIRFENYNLDSKNKYTLNMTPINGEYTVKSYITESDNVVIKRLFDSYTVVNNVKLPSYVSIIIEYKDNKPIYVASKTIIRYVLEN